MSESEPNLDISFPSLPSSIGLTSRPAKIDCLKASDASKLSYRFWPGRTGSPVILYLHGIEGHSQWFENTASALNERGFTIYALDRRGSGMNTQSRGHIRDYRILLNDLEMFILHIRRQYSNNSLFLMANCWAAKLATIAAQYGYTYSDKSLMSPFAGLIFTNPAIYTCIDLPLFTKLQIACSWLFGNKEKVWPIPLTTHMLTNNPEYIDYLQKDPLRLTSATASFFIQTFLLTLKAQQTAKNIRRPTLILQAGSDEIVDIKKLENWYEKIPAADKSMRILPEASHSLDFDKAWFKEYTNILSDWIAKHASAYEN